MELASAIRILVHRFMATMKAITPINMILLIIGPIASIVEAL